MQPNVHWVWSCCRSRRGDVTPSVVTLPGCKLYQLTTRYMMNKIVKLLRSRLIWEKIWLWLYKWRKISKQNLDFSDIKDLFREFLVCSPQNARGSLECKGMYETSRYQIYKLNRSVKKWHFEPTDYACIRGSLQRCNGGKENDGQFTVLYLYKGEV